MYPLRELHAGVTHASMRSTINCLLQEKNASERIIIIITAFGRNIKVELNISQQNHQVEFVQNPQSNQLLSITLTFPNYEMIPLISHTGA